MLNQSIIRLYRMWRELLRLFFVTDFPDSLDERGFGKNDNHTVVLSCHIFVSVARFQRLSKTETNVSNKEVPGNKHVHRPTMSTNAPTKLPVKQSYASMTHGDVISKGIQLNRENANCIQLSDNDLIKVEYTTFVVLVKVKEIDSINNMFCICRNEGKKEGNSFSIESVNDGKHDEVENKYVDSDATIPPGFEIFFKVNKHGSRSPRTGDEDD
ncbi:hypothetical protein Tco_0657624 [Tanacetum coccineum]